MKGRCKVDDETRLIRELTEGPTLLMRAMADLCSDKGRDMEAAGWRFMADNKRMPCFGKRGYVWIVTTMSEDPRTMPTFGEKRDNHRLSAGNMHLYKTYFDLGEFLQESARRIGTLIADEAKCPPKKKRRTYADMSQEERELRREIRSANQDLREFHFDLFDEAFFGGSVERVRPNANGRRLYAAWLTLKGRLNELMGNETAEKFVSYEDWFNEYRRRFDSDYMVADTARLDDPDDEVQGPGR
jgi:hypothetical protein